METVLRLVGTQRLLASRAANEVVTRYSENGTGGACDRMPSFEDQQGFSWLRGGGGWSPLDRAHVLDQEPEGQ